MSPISFLRKITPRPLMRVYHRLLAWAAVWWAGRPTRHMIVIGVTGTDGKTTTATLIADLFQAAGRKVGLSSSVYYQVGEKRWLNESHMTMPGRFALQSMLRDMVKAKCDVAVLEVSSEGIRQHRHTGIDFDAAVITNLSAEHIESHGSFEAYRQAKGRLFERLIKSPDKKIRGEMIKRISVVNVDDPSADYYLKFWAEQRFGTTLKSAPELPSGRDVPMTVMQAKNIQTTARASTFEVDGHTIQLTVPGRYNVANALQAITVARAYGVDWQVIETELAKPRMIPGRAESYEKNGARIVIDYALTPAALRALYTSIREGGAKRMIAVLGAAGGGRDHWKRPELGVIAAEFANVIILTTDDPYDEDPAEIAAQIGAGIPAASTATIETILDRKAAIQHAIQIAQPGDVVAITGMGSETSMMVKGHKVPWSDAAVVKEMLS